MPDKSDYQAPLPSTHRLKTLPTMFEAVLSGRKTAELRRSDRGFKVGDYLDLFEFDPGGCPGDQEGIIGLTGEAVLVEVTHIVEGGQYGLERGYCMLSFAIVGLPDAR